MRGRVLGSAHTPSHLITGTRASEDLGVPERGRGRCVLAPVPVDTKCAHSSCGPATVPLHGLPPSPQSTSLLCARPQLQCHFLKAATPDLQRKLLVQPPRPVRVPTPRALCTPPGTGACNQRAPSPDRSRTGKGAPVSLGTPSAQLGASTSWAAGQHLREGRRQVGTAGANGGAERLCHTCLEQPPFVVRTGPGAANSRVCIHEGDTGTRDAQEGPPDSARDWSWSGHIVLEKRTHP